MARVQRCDPRIFSRRNRRKLRLNDWLKVPSKPFACQLRHLLYQVSRLEESRSPGNEFDLVIAFYFRWYLGEGLAVHTHRRGIVLTDDEIGRCLYASKVGLGQVCACIGRYNSMH